MPRQALDDAMVTLRLVVFGVTISGPIAAVHAQQLSVISQTVGQPGDFGRICVALSGGQAVAGIQNDLVWDGNCATLSDESSCGAVGSHGKQVHFKLQQQDFRIRALALSLSDTRAMGDGPVYCCNMQCEAAPGSCCSISIVGAQGSDSGGKAVGVQGVAGQICTASGGGGRSFGSIDQPRQPLGGTNANTMAEPAAPQAPAAPAGAAPAAAPPPAQVLPGGGGGARIGPAASAAVSGASPVEAVLPARTPVLGLSAVPTSVAGRASAPAPALPPATAAAAVATPSAAAVDTAMPVDTATPNDTPTHAVDTPVATRAAPASSPTAPGPTLTPTKPRGWLGCQIAPGASAWPLLGLVAGAAACLARRRRGVSDR